MITLLNMIFANPLAYRVFPLIANPYNTGITDTAIYTGYILVTDSNGTTKSFSNTNIIDFSGFTGIIDIDLYTDAGSVKLGRWDTSVYSPWVLMYFDYSLTLSSLPANGYNSGTNNTEISIGAVYVDRSTMDLTSWSGSSIPWYCFEDFSGDYDWFTISNVGTRASYGEGRCYFDIEVEPNTADEPRSYDIPVSWSWTRSEDDPDTFFEGLDHVSGSGIITITQEGGGVIDMWDMSIVIDDRFSSIPYDGITTTFSDGWWVGVVATNEYRGLAILLPTHCYSVEDLSGPMNATLDGSVSSTHDNEPVYNVLFTAPANTEKTTKNATLRIRLRMTRQDCIDILGDDRLMGYIGAVTTTVTLEAVPWIAPYTPAFSMAFSMTTSGQAGKQITNGIEIYQTSTATGDESYHFFAYTEDITPGERYYSATIQVSGLPEGYTIQGIRGWDSVTITLDGEYTIPEFTCPELDLYELMPYDDKPAFMFTSDVPAETVFDTPIKIVITAVQSMEESINEHMVLWYDLAKLGATNESMATTPTLIDHSGNGHDATCYNFAWGSASGIGSYSLDPNYYGLRGMADSSIENAGYKYILRTTSESLLHVGKMYTVTDTSSPFIRPAFKLKVSGLEEGEKWNLYEDISVKGGNGEFDIQEFVDSRVTENWVGINVAQTFSNRNIVIEILPQYPNALVSDGVDDYCLVEGLPLLNKEDGYTVIAKRKILSSPIGVASAGIASKRITPDETGAFVFEKLNHVEGVYDIVWNFGAINNNVLINKDTSISVLTSTMYNNANITKGANTDNNMLLLFSGLKTPSFFGEIANAALYSFLLFNRDLTTEEIEWVKTNLIETEQ